MSPNPQNAAHERGVSAALAGISKMACPYRAPVFREAWHRGWEQGHSTVKPKPMPVEYQRVMASVTTCKRLDLFRHTMQSFMESCEDLDLIDSWLVMDHGSSPEDVEAMQAEFPFLRGRVIEHRPSDCFSEIRGDIFNLVPAWMRWVLYLEDDWFFHRKGHFIREAQAIMCADTSIREVSFRYWPCPVVQGPGDLRYRLHEFLGRHGPWPDLYDCHWWGYTCNPSLQDVGAVKSMLPFPKTGAEIGMAQKWHTAGYATAHTLKGYIKHIGDGRSVFDVERKPR